MIIFKEAIDNAAGEYGYDVYKGTGEGRFRYVAENGFETGANFVESKIEGIAVEFAEWILQHTNPSFGIIGGYKSPNKWMDTIQGNRIDYSTKELFEMFLKERSNG